MVSRAAHYRNKARHAQREFGQVKPRLLDRDEATSWQGAFIATLSNDMPAFNVDSPIAASLGSTPEARSLRLRELCKIGVLRMSAHRENNVFIEYRWTVTKGE
ncbi:hypothetical protein SEA_JEMERALD_30 [Microbacterium phage Jemerald]|nr:hypothetical protein SEA_JUICER_30 [Microbacterium phage Juicer]WNO27269.1 hypothetical protein SEA_JEMERALD_30 [Microbacterium phage Jemerald]